MEAFKTRSFRCLAFILAAASAAALAQAPDYPNIGRAPTPEEIQAWDISIGQSGKELPPGKGTAKEGAAIYAKRCAACHGADLQGGVAAAPRLQGGQGTLTSNAVKRSIGSYWPFPTTIWDYINRAMPPTQRGSLTPDDVYALTAFLLFKNDIIKETDVMDAASLPKVHMPNRENFIPLQPEWKKDQKRPYGQYQ